MGGSASTSDFVQAIIGNMYSKEMLQKYQCHCQKRKGFNDL